MWICKGTSRDARTKLHRDRHAGLEQNEGSKHFYQVGSGFPEDTGACWEFTLQEPGLVRPSLTHPHGAGVHGHCLEMLTFPFKGIECRVGIQDSPEIFSELFDTVLLHLYLSTGLSWGSGETVVETEDKTPSLRKGRAELASVCSHALASLSFPFFLPSSLFSYLYPTSASWGCIMGIFKAL